jgi:Na+:H+ antiporter, NhaA family
MSRQRPRFNRSRSLVVAFLQTETTGGLLLIGATVIALIWVNAYPHGYESLWHADLSLGTFDNDLRHWVNDGLMSIFFFVVGLEIKRELVTGELRDLRMAAAPIAAAIGGMLLPAAIYFALNTGEPGEAGWAIPIATDIAFVLGLNALLGHRTPQGLRIFLLTLAIVDDVAAILVIAIFYSSDTRWLWLAASAGAIVLIAGLRALKVNSPVAYVIPALLLWSTVFESGIHPTIAGVALGLLMPAHPLKGRDVMAELQRCLHPLSSFVVVPVFALANAGLVLSVDSIRDAVDSRIFWGIVAGLVLGKTLGIFGATGLSRRLRLGRLPRGVGRRDLFGGAALAGIGFTVSLFITGLAFSSERLVNEAKLGVFGGSLLSAAVGIAISWRPTHDPDRA